MAYIDVTEWSPEHVAEWMRGLGPPILSYTHKFLNNNIDGSRLLRLGESEIEQLGVKKVGHQLVIVDGIEQLRKLHYDLNRETLQTMASRFDCAAQNLSNIVERQHKILMARPTTFRRAVQEISAIEQVDDVEILAATSLLLERVREFTDWIDSPPFRSDVNYFKLRNAVIHVTLEIYRTAMQENLSPIENPLSHIARQTISLRKVSNFILRELLDSLVMQPVTLEVVTARKSEKEPVWGMIIRSRTNGNLFISTIDPTGPVQACGRIEQFDGVVQINRRTVVGWTINNITELVKTFKQELVLTLKKCPRHLSPDGERIYYPILPHRLPMHDLGPEKMVIEGGGFPAHIHPEPGSPTVHEDENLPFRLPAPVGSGLSGSMSSILVGIKAALTHGRRRKIQRRATVTGAYPSTFLEMPSSSDDVLFGCKSSEDSNPTPQRAARDIGPRSFSHDCSTFYHRQSTKKTSRQ